MNEHIEINFNVDGVLAGRIVKNPDNEYGITFKGDSQKSAYTLSTTMDDEIADLLKKTLLIYENQPKGVENG